MQDRIHRELQDLYKLREKLRSQIARIDSKITALDHGPVGKVGRGRRRKGDAQSPAHDANYQPLDGHA